MVQKINGFDDINPYYYCLNCSKVSIPRMWMFSYQPVYRIQCQRCFSYVDIKVLSIPRGYDYEFINSQVPDALDAVIQREGWR